jgi:ankyrin repeat protein
LEVCSGDYLFEPLECLEQQRIGRFYRSFADLLVPFRPGFESQDELDINRRIQEALPGILSNMPERYDGQRDLVIETLLGPPQLSAALCLVEIAIFLYSNNQLSTFGYQSNSILQWIVETIPFSSLRKILQSKLPTLQAFQFALLLFAIENSNLRLIKDLLELSTGLKDWDAPSSRVLETAILKRDPEVVELVLGIIPDVPSLKDKNWQHSLLEEGFSIQIAEVLTKAGVHLHIPIYPKTYPYTGFYTYPIIEAIRHGDIDLTRFLISVGADVNAVPELVSREQGEQDRFPPYHLMTPLKMAIYIGRIDIFFLLLNNGADVHKGCGHHYYVNSFLGRVEWDPTEEKMLDFVLTPLQVAAAAGNLEMVTALHRAGSRVNDPAHGHGGVTALFAATLCEQLPVVDFLLQNGANVNAHGGALSRFSYTPLSMAVYNNNDALVELLLNSGADPNAPVFAYHGVTVLETAKIRNSSSRIVSLLLKSGAVDKIRLKDPVKSRYMKTQLLRAVRRGDSEHVYRLLDVGIELNMGPTVYSCLNETTFFPPDDDKIMTVVTLLQMAIASERVELPLFVHLLEHFKQDRPKETYERSLEPLLCEAIHQQRIDFAEALLAAGVHINALSPTSRIKKTDGRLVPTPTALHIASAIGHAGMVSWILDRDVDVDRRLAGTSTPLQLALDYDRLYNDREAQCNRLDVFDLLLNRCADINATPASEDGYTVLQSTIKTARESWSPVITLVQRLLELGADVNAPAAERNGRTAL